MDKELREKIAKRIDGSRCDVCKNCGASISTDNPADVAKDIEAYIKEAGYVAGWNEAKAIVAKVNAEAGDIRVFERMILAAFILTQGQGLIGNDD